MNRMKKYLLPLLTVLCIALGAMLPSLTFQMQDTQLSGQSEYLELNVASLTLKQDSEVGTALRLFADMRQEETMVNASSTDISWDGNTGMSEEDVYLAAIEAIDAIAQAGLVSKEDRVRLDYAVFEVNPFLRVAGNGDSARVWECSWETEDGLFYNMIVDDATGKAVRILTGLGSFEYEMTEPELLERWLMFLSDYYGIEVVDIIEDIQTQEHSGARAAYLLETDLKDGLEPCMLHLQIFNRFVFFN